MLATPTGPEIFAKRVQKTLKKHGIKVQWVYLAPKVLVFTAGSPYGQQASFVAFDVQAHAATTDKASPVSSHDVAYSLRIRAAKR